MPNTTQESLDLLIRNASVVDGTGAPRFRADIGIRGDRIARIGDLSRADAAIGVSTGLFYEPANHGRSRETLALPEYAGRDLSDIAAAMGVSQDEAIERLNPAGAIYFKMDEADVQRILRFEPTMIGSDGLPHDASPHPRLWGTFPRILGHYSRELALFPLETAVHKMTGLTAKNFGLRDRGVLKEGAYADLTLFDADTVDETATYAAPIAPARGIETVIVNGEIVWTDGASTGARPGRVLRRETALDAGCGASA